MAAPTPSRGTMYCFKDITTVHQAKDLIDIVLSSTNRKTPTVVHPQFKISRIRSFYMRKVKYCQQTFHDKFTQILTEFPRLDDIHPFYADLCNVLYDRDHYKIALGQVNTVRAVVDRVAKDYVRLLKYADSPYKCKMLKRAALGRMCTTVKKLNDSTKYLEEVRKHLSRLPSIQPTARTLILTGFPNVGKSSFINSISHANVEVQPYAFTTKSLYVGHFDYNLLRWQVIDTPGILDHPLANRNTIELTAITALAHIHAAVLFFLDISEQCGFSIAAQVSLFDNIKVLFQKKPLVIVLNKVDVVRFDSLDPADQALIKGMTKDLDDVMVLETSCLTKEGIDNAKNKACEMLLTSRIEQKIASNTGNAAMSGLQVTKVEIPSSRPPVVPETVVARRQRQAEKRAARLARKGAEVLSEGETNSDAASDSDDGEDVAMKKNFVLSKQKEAQGGGAGVFSYDMNADWNLRDGSWAYDVMPEIFNGKNIADFIDPDIEAKLQALEEEESRLLAEEQSRDPLTDPMEWSEVASQMHKLARKRNLVRQVSQLNNNSTRRYTPRKCKRITETEMAEKLTELGYNLDSFTGGLKVREKRHRSVLDTETLANRANDEDFATDGRSALNKRIRLLRASRTVATGENPFAQSIRSIKQDLALRRTQMSMRDEATRRAVARLAARKQQRTFRKEHLKGEGDHSIPAKKPKHLFSGHRGVGKSDWR